MQCQNEAQVVSEYTPSEKDREETEKIRKQQKQQKQTQLSMRVSGSGESVTPRLGRLYQTQRGILSPRPSARSPVES